MPAPITIGIADDHQLLRDSLRSLLEVTGKFKVTLEAADGLELIGQLANESTLPDMCLTDLYMPRMNGYETLIALKRKWPDMRVVLLSIYDHELILTRALQAGAATCLDKNIKNTILFEALEQVHTLGYYHTEKIANVLIGKVNREKEPRITDKELRFLCLCKSDLGYKEIAQLMGVETRTVENYRDSLFDKLKIHTRSGLISYTMRHGLDHLFTGQLAERGQ